MAITRDYRKAAGAAITAFAVAVSSLGSFAVAVPPVFAATAVFTNNGAAANNLNPGMVDILVLDITLPPVDSDTFLDGDGTASTGAGTPGAITAGDAMIKNFVAAGVFCANTDGTTPPTNLVVDTDASCSDADTLNETVVLGGNAALNNLDDAVASQVLFRDDNSNGVWNSGEDIYFDVDDSTRYNADKLDAITVRNSGTAVTATDIALVKLWVESSGNNAFGTDDTVIDSDCTWDGANDWECDVADYQFTAQIRVYVTVNVATGATNNRTIQMQVAPLSDAGTAGAFNTGDTGIFFSEAGTANTGNHDGPTSAITNANVQTIVVPPPPTKTADTTPPGNPSIVINDGAEKTSSQTVTLKLSATDAGWVFVSENSSFTGVPSTRFNPVGGLMSMPFILSSGDGPKTVYAQFMDDAGNRSAVVSDTITLETGAIPPDTPPPPPPSPPFGQVTPESSTVADGDLVRASNTVEVYVTKKVGATVVIRHIVNPRIFDVYGHFGGVAAWSKVVGVDSLGAVKKSAWVRGSDGKVWEVNGDGTKHWMRMSWEQFAQRVASGDSDLAANLVFEVNEAELGLYTTGPDVLP